MQVMADFAETVKIAERHYAMVVIDDSARY
jgi:hypothetical protein